MKRDGFVITLWTYYEPLISREISSGDYANALQRLHPGTRELDVATAHFSGRVKSAQRLVRNRTALRRTLATHQRRTLATYQKEFRQRTLGKPRAVVQRRERSQRLGPNVGGCLERRTVGVGVLRLVAWTAL